jgi:outer membrane protein OmpA-like peptidoglycan-associated protein
MAQGSKSIARTSSFIVGAMLAGVVTFGSSEAQAQGFVNRLAFRGEATMGTMLSEHQRTNLGFDNIGFEGTLRIGVHVIDALSINVSLANWFFPSSRPAPDDGMGRVLGITGGLRLEPRIGSVGRLWLEGNFGYGFTGDKGRLYLDAGLGFEFQVSRAFAIGPMVRYGHVFQTNDYANLDELSFNEFFKPDAQWIAGGVSLTVRIPEPEVQAIVAPTDTDADGVVDPDDQCPTTPQGANPDPARRGCPLSDTDGDGVFDNDDQCVNVPAGRRPDPARRGCPVSDQDGDGVADGEDQCPTQPQGMNPDPARRGCPLSDQDSDGVFDNDDQCPTQPQGAHPDPARRGCPIGDRDNDGITDDVDRCPDQAETFNGRDDTDGCPDGDALARTEGGQIRIMDQVKFRTNRATIQGRRSFAVLDAVVAIMRATASITQLDVQGHTDDRGDAAHNRQLSQERAAAVVQYLTQHGIEAGRLTSHGFGPDRPLVEGTSRRARAANRRVEFHINGQ